MGLAAVRATQGLPEGRSKSLEGIEWASILLPSGVGRRRQRTGRQGIADRVHHRGERYADAASRRRHVLSMLIQDVLASRWVRPAAIRAVHPRQRATVGCWASGRREIELVLLGRVMRSAQPPPRLVRRRRLWGTHANAMVWLPMPRLQLWGEADPQTPSLWRECSPSSRLRKHRNCPNEVYSEGSSLREKRSRLLTKRGQVQVT